MLPEWRQSVAVAVGVSLIDKCGKTADKINADSAACVVKSFGQRHIACCVAAFAHNGNRCYGYALVNNGHAKFRFQLLPYFNKVFCFFGNFIVNFLRRYLNIRVCAVTQLMPMVMVRTSRLFSVIMRVVSKNVFNFKHRQLLNTVHSRKNFFALHADFQRLFIAKRSKHIF